jgi:Xylose isomerase-like TIM barrel
LFRLDPSRARRDLAPVRPQEDYGGDKFMGLPKLACCNFISEPGVLKEFALDHAFEGIDWSFNPVNFPLDPAGESALMKTISGFHPLEIRYHWFWENTDLGDEDPEEAKSAMRILRRVCRLVSKLRGRVLTIHVGLGRDSTEDLSWNRTVHGLTELTSFSNNLGVRLCLENLDWGWTGRPDLYEKLIRKSGCWATLDIGHALVSQSVVTRQYRIEDFVDPQPERFLNAHVYHKQIGKDHTSPSRVADVADRLTLLTRLPLCDWWTLELKDEASLMQTLDIVRRFLTSSLDRKVV